MDQRATASGPLSRSRRLTALVVLREHGAAMTPAELAAAVARRESGRSPSTVENGHVERVLLSLRRSHLPALSDAGLLTRDGVSDPDAEERVGLAADAVDADARRVLDAVFASDAEDESATEA
ncbi:DUF7344 domain-containing protein [Halogeometricum luteum]|uniref:DUF7344 domain-containing protein n=1 Tax=Halogeometricum luteum TaxID=2950537 RepID=A0ABU2FYH3_9EURY|nr:hypothetical protein [Halogeometricum sp. S3BR5-2]MDS0293577.1 hypothetical protein [Halogeometricum sp. S3BR5-2]